MCTDFYNENITIKFRLYRLTCKKNGLIILNITFPKCTHVTHGTLSVAHVTPYSTHVSPVIAHVTAHTAHVTPERPCNICHTQYCTCNTCCTRNHTCNTCDTLCHTCNTWIPSVKHVTPYMTKKQVSDPVREQCYSCQYHMLGQRSYTKYSITNTRCCLDSVTLPSFKTLTCVRLLPNLPFPYCNLCNSSCLVIFPRILSHNYY